MNTPFKTLRCSLLATSMTCLACHQNSETEVPETEVFVNVETLKRSANEAMLRAEMLLNQSYVTPDAGKAAIATRGLEQAAIAIEAYDKAIADYDAWRPGYAKKLKILRAYVYYVGVCLRQQIVMHSGADASAFPVPFKSVGEWTWTDAEDMYELLHEIPALTAQDALDAHTAVTQALLASIQVYPENLSQTIKLYEEDLQILDIDAFADVLRADRALARSEFGAWIVYHSDQYVDPQAFERECAAIDEVDEIDDRLRERAEQARVRCEDLRRRFLGEDDVVGQPEETK
jgi:hypothetical protein